MNQRVRLLIKAGLIVVCVLAYGCSNRPKTKGSSISALGNVILLTEDSNGIAGYAEIYGLLRDRPGGMTPDFRVLAFKKETIFKIHEPVYLTGGDDKPGYDTSCKPRKTIFSTNDKLSVDYNGGNLQLKLELQANGGTEVIRKLVPGRSIDGHTLWLQTAPLPGTGIPDVDPKNYDYYVTIVDTTSPEEKSKPKHYRVEAFPSSSWVIDATCKDESPLPKPCDCERPDAAGNLWIKRLVIDYGGPVGETHSGEGDERN